jgi:VWFA-related protein
MVSRRSFDRLPRLTRAAAFVRSGARLGVLAAALAVAVASPARSQAPAETPPETLAQEPPIFGEVIEVTVVDVEVVVTDERGERVRGLGRGDFRLRVTGREVPIDFFDEIRDGRTVPAPAGSAGDDAAGAATQAEPATAEEPAPVRYLVFLDDYFTDRRYRAAMLDRVIGELSALRPDDRMAVVRFAGGGLELLADWTASAAELERVLREARRMPTMDLARETRLATFTDPTEQVRLLAGQVKETVGAVVATMRGYSDVPERKVLLLASSGWPHQLWPLPISRRLSGDDPSDRAAVLQENIDTDTRAGRARSEAGRLGGRKLIAPVSDAANLLGYTVYPLHLGTHLGNPGAGARSLTGGADVDQMEPFLALQHVADETGGRLVAYAQAIERPFEAVTEDTATYYSLGFRAPMVGDGGRREIEVEVLRPGLEVRHRRGYRDLTRAERADLETEAALLTGGTGGPPLEVVLGAPSGGVRSIELPFTVSIPMDWVTMVPTGPGVYAADLELRVAALDEKGDRSELTAIPIQLRGPAPPPGSHATYEAAVKLRRRAQRLVFTLTDPLGGGTLSSTYDFAP